MFGVFTEISAFRQGGFSGGQPLQPSEIEAWLRLRKITLAQWELDMILVMDREILEGAAGGQTPETSPTGEVVSTRPLTPELFDILFP